MLQSLYFNYYGPGSANKAGNGLAAARPLPKTVPRCYKSPGECWFS